MALAPISIRGSVGYKGQNISADVMAVQKRLNELMKAPRVALAVDGRSGPKTEGMILDFQKNAMNNPRGDAKVDPGGATLKALNDQSIANKWSGAAPAPLPSPGAPPVGGGQYPTAATQQEKIIIDKLVASAKATNDPWVIDIINKMLKNEFYNDYKNLINALGTAQLWADFGQTLKGLRIFGADSREMLSMFKDAAKLNGEDLKALIEIVRKFPEVTKAIRALKVLGAAVNVATVIVCAAEVVDHMRNDRPGAAMAEIYGTVMQFAVPWAGAVDAIQSIAYAYAPGMKNSPAATYFFRLLNAVNPIGAGKVAVDSYFTIVETALISFRKGTFDSSKLELLVGRMKQTPMNVFVGWGEALGDYMGDKFGDFYYEHFLK